MGQTVIEEQLIDALKLFNNSISTRRVYPPGAPQIRTASERGYAKLAEVLTAFQKIEFSNINGVPHINGIPLEKESLSLMPNLAVFRQLELFEKSCIVFKKGLDQFSYDRIVEAFAIPAPTIKAKNGGTTFLDERGLGQFFPEKETLREAAESNTIDTEQPKVRPELIDCLFGNDMRPLLEKDMLKRLAKEESACELVKAATLRVLDNTEKNSESGLILSPDFTKMLSKLDLTLQKDLRNNVLIEYSHWLVHLPNGRLCTILMQNFSCDFGQKLYSALLQNISPEYFAELIESWRKKQNLAPNNAAETALQSLLSTEQGKRFLSLEKAKGLITASEKKRKKKRIEQGIKTLLSGEKRGLSNPEIIEQLPLAVIKLQEIEKEKVALRLISDMGEALLAEQTGKSSNPTVKKAMIDSLIQLGERLTIRNKRPSKIESHITEILCSQATDAVLSPTHFQPAMTLLCKMMGNAWLKGNDALGDHILQFQNLIKEGKSIRTPKDTNAGSLSIQLDKIQRETISGEVLEYLLSLFLKSEGKSEKESFRMLSLGTVSARFLMLTLIRSQSRAIRNRIIPLLAQIKPAVNELLHERLDQEMPWYSRCSLLSLFAKIGQKSDIDAVRKFLHHNDLRVRREAFKTLFFLAGVRRKDIFIEELDVNDEAVQIMLIDALGNIGGREVAAKLGELLERHESFTENFHNHLVLTIVEALGKCGVQNAQTILKRFVQEKDFRSSRNISPRIWEALEYARALLNSDVAIQKRQRELSSQKVKTSFKAPQLQGIDDRRIMFDMTEDSNAHELLEEGRKADAQVRILKLIGIVLRNKNIQQAQNLRDWLYKIDPNDIGALLSADDLVRTEQNRSGFHNHLETFTPLYDTLTAEEAEELFARIEHTSYDIGKQLLEEGAPIKGLFFVNSGALRLTQKERNTKSVQATVNAGEIFGGEALTEKAQVAPPQSIVWKFDAEALATIDISVIHSEQLAAWRSTNPGLVRKIEEFCAQLHYPSLITAYRRNKQTQPPKGLPSLAQAQLLLTTVNREMLLLPTMKVLETSKYGMYSTVTGITKKTLTLLLGQSCQLRFIVNNNEDSTETTANAVITEIERKGEQEAVFYIKFTTNITEKQLQRITAAKV